MHGPCDGIGGDSMDSHEWRQKNNAVMVCESGKNGQSGRRFRLSMYDPEQ